MASKVVPLPMAINARRAEELVRAIAERDRSVKFTTHALERMDLRDISLADVMRVLMKGTIQDPPKVGKGRNEWKVKVIRHHRGCRDIGVVTMIIREAQLLILTVEWEDLS